MPPNIMLPTESRTAALCSPHVLVDARFSARRRGGDRCRYELAAYLSDQAAARYTFLTYADTRTMLSERCGDVETITTDSRPNRHPQGDIFEHVSLPLIGRRLCADIYHGTFNVLPLMDPAPITVLTIHDMAVFAHPEAYGRRFATYGRALIRAGVRRATQILSVSDATAQEITRYIPDAADKIVTIRNGVGEEFLRAASLGEREVGTVCARLNIPRPYVLFVGNLEPKKNLPRLIESFQRLQASAHLPHTLVIVGERLSSGPDGVPGGEERPGAIHFAGYVEDADLPVLYRGADLVAYPSTYEGFGMPVLEGMAAGVPVLTSSISSLPEVAGGAAMLVDPYDIEEMATGLHRALTDHQWRATASVAGLARAKALSWAENARQTSDVYHRLWAAAGGGAASRRHHS